MRTHFVIFDLIAQWSLMIARAQALLKRLAVKIWCRVLLQLGLGKNVGLLVVDRKVLLILTVLFIILYVTVGYILTALIL